MLKKESIALLKDAKNLLAFSAGVDSSALFHLLIEYNIPFDIAIVNYNIRPESQEEFNYAQQLATKHNIICHTHTVNIEHSNMEMHARSIRYKFFTECIQTYHYTTLLTAHQLNDKLEWFLMQLSKGSSLLEMLGMQAVEKRNGYTLHRPLLHVSRKEIYEYLHVNSIHYFEDTSNKDTYYKRNLFRETMSNFLLQEYQDGIAHSFEYLQEEADAFFRPCEYKAVEELYYFPNYPNTLATIKMIDITLKKLAILMHHGDRERLKKEKTLVVARKMVVNISTHYTFIAPFIQIKAMDKAFKERCRILKIHPLIRGYCYKEEAVFSKVCELLASE